ncbi:MAG: CoA transferase, partial [Halieaceae bacterium]|nr:CoA transferase [Halieaceae bacterium]
VAAAGLFSDFSDGSGRTVNSPLYVTGAQKRSPAPAPEVGQHSVGILADLGLDAETIADLQGRGVVG